MLRLIFLVAVLFSIAFGHSYLTIPTEGKRGPEFEHCRPDPGYAWNCGYHWQDEGPVSTDNCDPINDTPLICYGPCDRKRSSSVSSYRRWKVIERGQVLPLQWHRNNHNGGFARIAWAKYEDSDYHQSFEVGVSHTQCYETGGCTGINGGLGNQDLSKPSENNCNGQTIVPTWLTDGNWTMQWMWFGGFQDQGEYYSCVDYIVRGGAAVTTRTPPTFTPNSVHVKNGTGCNTWHTEPHICQDGPCHDPVIDDWTVARPNYQGSNMDVFFSPRNLSVIHNEAKFSFITALNEMNFKVYRVSYSRNPNMANAEYLDFPTIIEFDKRYPTRYVPSKFRSIHVTLSNLEPETTYYVQTTVVLGQVLQRYRPAGITAEQWEKQEGQIDWTFPLSSISSFTTASSAFATASSAFTAESPASIFSISIVLLLVLFLAI